MGVASLPGHGRGKSRIPFSCLRHLAALGTALAQAALAQPTSVTTHHNNNARTGANLAETLLNTSNVNTNQFGLLWTCPVDDQVYAQPLVMTNVNIPGQGTHNVVYVATVNDSVYAFDADSPSVTGPYWQVSFLGPNVSAPMNTDMAAGCSGGYQDFSGHIGIVGTPVIEPTAGTIFLVARSKEVSGNVTSFVQRLHALDMTTGAERPNSPVVIMASYRGTGDGSVNQVLTFDPLRQNQRPGLALVNGVVYIAWASHCDWTPYHGWVMGYDATTLQQVLVYNDTPNGYNGGIWMSGQAPSADNSGNLYLSTGNGSVGSSSNPADTINRGESFLKLTPSGTNFTVASWFTPYNWSNLEKGDTDLGSAGLLLIPGTSLAFSGGKQGVLYLVNRDNMGGLSLSGADANIVQSIALSGEVHGAPVWWDGAQGSYAYVWVAGDYLRQYKFDWGTQRFQLPEYAQSRVIAAGGQPGGILALSANGTSAGRGILWASRQLDGDANQVVRRGILHAFDAQNVSNELWNSEQLSARDAVGLFAKFVPPTEANGKVYLATFSNQLDVYGLLQPQLSVVLSGRNVVLSWPANAFGSYSLQMSPDLALGDWSNVTNGVAAANSSFNVIVPATDSQAFYRLKK